MSNYKNIFHYYRGQTKGKTEDTKQLQIENNVTKAFLNVLQHSSPELTTHFFKFIGFDYTNTQTYDYRYQVKNRLESPTKAGVILGIAESTEVHKGLKKSFNIPDGAILSNKHSLLIENKIGYNSYLEHYQLEGHKKIFALGTNYKEDPIILTWSEIRGFLKNQLEFFKSNQDSVTCFLIEQFEEFCIINCIGDRQKSKEYFFLKFEKLQAQKLARQIDNYIWQHYSNQIEDAGTKDGIGYRKITKTKFVTLTTARQRCLILHVGKKENRYGLLMQKEIDRVLGRNFERKDYEYDKYPHEAYIRLEWVESLNQISSFIDRAYNSK
ncbi:hypothetical protein ACW2QC_01180 [Virgibacillus sp. FSP13]